MKRKLIIFLALVTWTAGLFSAMAAEPPKSAEQLRAKLESAFRNKDTNAVFLLINWDGVSERMKAFERRTMVKAVQHGVAGVKLLPLSADDQLTDENNGVRFSPNLTPVGLIEIDFVRKDNAETTPKVTRTMPYGKKGDAFYLCCNIETKISVKK